MIPRTLHFCWFGGKPYPPLARRCMASWERHAPGYQLRRWDEGNVRLDYPPFVVEAAKAKAYAFIADYARLRALYEEGGIYLDTDVELFQALDPFLECPGFAGYETEGILSTALIGAEAGNPLVKEILDLYESRDFSTKPNTQVISELLSGRIQATKEGYDEVLGALRIYPKEYFSPLEMESRNHWIGPRTAAIHHFSGSWLPAHRRFAIWIKKRSGIDLRGLKRLLPRCGRRGRGEAV